MQPYDIRAWRKRLHLTQAEAAEKLFVSRSQVIRWEAGETPVDARTALACHHMEIMRDLISDRAHLLEGKIKHYHGHEDISAERVAVLDRYIAEMEGIIETYLKARNS